MNRLPPPAAVAPRGPLAKIAWATAGAVVLVVGAILSVAVLAVGLVVGAAALGYLAWKTRAVRRAVRETLDERAAQAPAGRVYDGVAVDVRDER
jgi:hypothetical protein